MPGKALYIIIGVVTIIVVLFIGFRGVTTDKDSYSSGEKVIILVSDFRLAFCDDTRGTEIYRETPSGWEAIETSPAYWRQNCVNGLLAAVVMPMDFISCTPHIVNLRGNYSWDQMAYKYTGLVSSCNASRDYNTTENIDYPIAAYNEELAGPGKYKIKFGSAEKIFEIR